MPADGAARRRQPAGPVWVRGDAAALERVVVNLGANAGDAIAAGGGHVRVAVTRTGALGRRRGGAVGGERRNRGDRRRRRHGRRRPGAPLRAVLHDQGRRHGARRPASAAAGVPAGSGGSGGGIRTAWASPPRRPLGAARIRRRRPRRERTGRHRPRPRHGLRHRPAARRHHRRRERAAPGQPLHGAAADDPGVLRGVPGRSASARSLRLSSLISGLERLALLRVQAPVAFGIDERLDTPSVFIRARLPARSKALACAARKMSGVSDARRSKVRRKSSAMPG